MGLLQFLKDNPVDDTVKQYKVKLDGRLANADPFVISTLSKTQYSNLQNMATKNNKMNTAKLAAMVVADSCVEPKFNDVELIKEYKVATPVMLVEKLLSQGEISALALQIIEASGLNVSAEQLEEEVKN